MPIGNSDDFHAGLFQELRKLPAETEWVEFKHNNANSEEIGQYVSALANSAALVGKSKAYLLWGVDDHSHAILGTSFRPFEAKVGNEALENWLLRLLNPQIHCRFFELRIDECPVVLLEIEAACRQPVQFSGEEFVRVGSYKKKLRAHPERERELWRIFENTRFESRVANRGIPGTGVLRLLDFQAYFKLLNLSEPKAPELILAALESDGMIARDGAGRWNISNLGAILFARRLSDFGTLSRKAVRVIVYRGKGRREAIREQCGSKGYANGFEGLIGFVNNLLPANEVVEKALRKNVTMYPEIAVRELVANALIHQDFLITGAGPMIEIFDDRLEITNPGAPLVETIRFLDTPPRSRNEALAAYMRRVGVCEERGSGVDKVVSETELYQLPAPVFESPGENTRSILFSHRSLNDMNGEDRVRACYLHACLKWVTREEMTNTTLRERFGIEKKNAAQASKIIRDTISSGLIRPFDDSVGTRALRYIPFWS
ncbi:MAG: putative DNA binding domain-containing protein [Candidatus Hydrogenedentes bacterium]|nr:putative DNA binding domain-containing protein [Candidatus Hydrogenedentota bacterium]